MLVIKGGFQFIETSPFIEFKVHFIDKLTFFPVSFLSFLKWFHQTCLSFFYVHIFYCITRILKVECIF